MASRPGISGIQGGHNYWNEIREAVDSVTATRKSSRRTLGDSLGYLVGEDEAQLMSSTVVSTRTEV